MEKKYCIMLRNKKNMIINEERFKKICEICIHGQSKFILLDENLINIVDIVCIVRTEEETNPLNYLPLYK